jgi:hypothetical protein
MAQAPSPRKGRECAEKEPLPWRRCKRLHQRTPWGGGGHRCGSSSKRQQAAASGSKRQQAAASGSKRQRQQRTHRELSHAIFGPAQGGGSVLEALLGRGGPGPQVRQRLFQRRSLAPGRVQVGLLVLQPLFVVPLALLQRGNVHVPLLQLLALLVALGFQRTAAHRTHANGIRRDTQPRSCVPTKHPLRALVHPRVPQTTPTTMHRERGSGQADTPPRTCWLPWRRRRRRPGRPAPALAAAPLRWQRPGAPPGPVAPPPVPSRPAPTPACARSGPPSTHRREDGGVNA